MLDFANFITNQTISPEMQQALGIIIIMPGVDNVTGQRKLFQPGDLLVRTNGAILAATGVQGITGFGGITGLLGSQGQTGVPGITGIQGITGFAQVAGITGLEGITGFVFQGDTGLTGSTGIIGLTGFIGITGIGAVGHTGILGETGLRGITGISPTGHTGLQGATGLLGETGIQGVTGFGPAGSSPSGATGSLQGATGISGITGVIVRGDAGSAHTLSAETQSSGSTMIYSITANTLNVDEQYLEFLTWGTTAADGQPTEITIIFGTTTIFSSTLARQGGANFVVRGLLMRVTTTSEEIIVHGVNSGSTNNIVTQRTVGAENLATALNLIVSLTSNGSGSAVRTLVVRKVPQV